MIDKLKVARTVDEPIIENMSPDWRAGQELLKNQLDKCVL